jgi:hypothetical protein
MAPSGHGWVTVAGRSGTRDPVGRPGPEGAQVPRAARPALLATFRLADSAGGAYAGGRNLAALRDGAASMAIDDTGRISVDQWGRDRRLGPDVVKVRQNLALIVDNGAPVPGLADNDDNRWGNARNQLQYTWRSASTRPGCCTTWSATTCGWTRSPGRWPTTARCAAWSWTSTALTCG